MAEKTSVDRLVKAVRRTLLSLASDVACDTQELCDLALSIASCPMNSIELRRQYLPMLRRLAKEKLCRRILAIRFIIDTEGGCLSKMYDLEKAAIKRAAQRKNKKSEAASDLSGAVLLPNECWAGKGSNSKAKRAAD